MEIPPEPLMPDNSLTTATPEEGRALAINLARHSIHAMQHELKMLKSGRAQYANDPYGLIAASHVVAVEFATSPRPTATGAEPADRLAARRERGLSGPAAPGRSARAARGARGQPACARMRLPSTVLASPAGEERATWVMRRGTARSREPQSGRTCGPPWRDWLTTTVGSPCP
jgi:hypothetical protein